MRSAIAYLISLAAGLAGMLWLTRLGGSVEIRFANLEIVVTLPIALLLLLIAFVLAHLLLRAISLLVGWPKRLRARRAERQRAEGDKAVTYALVALATGSAENARTAVRKARRSLGDTPQTLLLAAQAERLAGREEAAAEVFRTLAARPDARFLGLRGLLRQAIRRGDWAAAQRLARQAEEAQPGAAWLRQERETLALRTRDWREALSLAAPGAGQAPLALAAAAAEEDAGRAAELERRAFTADPAFAPAAVAHATRLRAAGEAKKARAVLEQAWAARPHPDVAAAYLADSAEPSQRLKAAETLTSRTARDPESMLLLARTAIEAGQLGRARRDLETLAASGKADRRAYLALSDLEEAEAGETAEGRVAQARWLRMAATATPEPRWRCAACGSDHAGWTPVCPSCEAAGTVGWTTPQGAKAQPQLAVEKAD